VGANQGIRVWTSWGVTATCLEYGRRRGIPDLAAGPAPTSSVNVQRSTLSEHLYMASAVDVVVVLVMVANKER
jgi:hypothetical protein